MSYLKRVAAIAVAVGSLAITSSASAGVAVYTSSDVPKFVADGATANSTLTVPPGRTAIQSIEVTNYGYSWGASGQELSAKLIAPDGSDMGLFEVGCFAWPDDSSITLTDSAAQNLPEKHGCDGLNLVGTSFRPVNFQQRKFSFFAGKPSSGTWTLRSTDASNGFTNQGTLLRWALRITHFDPVLKASAPATGKASKELTVTVNANANGTVVTGGGAKEGKTSVVAGKSTAVHFRVTNKIRNKARKKGKARANVTLTFTDETGGKNTQSVSLKIKP